ncbi:hypothetical protein K505DRAFT_358715 [Melanomma pulvis-pyrius CBS 109.77]|uniref:Uncharacterized protein n=1 Tax=Melanomma pulvis-pyrius CBS 109.77 TaxID=1314802 RepID=A0A6A6XLZ4_9PLEO|nr:hypothetical protein K505DRAFT_358715 [Melanomma pulvis-pyrius CBS 109.77]
MPVLPSNTTIPAPQQPPEPYLPTMQNPQDLLFGLLGLLIAAATLTVAYLHFHSERERHRVPDHSPPTVPSSLEVDLSDMATETNEP